nr:hypothetical protein PRUPE_1G485900 [Ipomoea batatas]
MTTMPFGRYTTPLGLNSSTASCGLGWGKETQTVVERRIVMLTCSYRSPCYQHFVGFQRLQPPRMWLRRYLSFWRLCPKSQCHLS